MKRIMSKKWKFYSLILSVLLILNVIILTVIADLDTVVTTSLLVLQSVFIGFYIFNIYSSMQMQKNLGRLPSSDQAYSVETWSNESESVKFDRIFLAEQRLQAIINLIPNAISVKDQNGKIILANQSFASMFGFNRRDVIGLNEKEFFSDEDAQMQLFEQDKKVLQSYQIEYLDIWINLKSTEKRFYQVAKIPAVDPILDESVVLSIYIDNTENFHRQQMLHSRSRVLSSIAENNNLEINISRLILDIESRCECLKLSIFNYHQDRIQNLASSDINTVLLDKMTVMLNNNSDFIEKYQSTRGLIMISSKDIVEQEPQIHSYIEQENIKAVWIKVVTDNDENKLGVIVFWSQISETPTASQLRDIEECSLLVNVAIANYKYKSDIKSYIKLLENSNSAFVLFKANGQIITSNHTAQKMFRMNNLDMDIRQIYKFFEKCNDSKLLTDLKDAIDSNSNFKSTIKFSDSGKSFMLSLNSTSENSSYFLMQVDDISSIVATKKESNNNLYYDEVTGLKNRGMLFERLQQMLDRSKRTKTTLGLFLIDLDYFKKINEQVGHDVADKVLKEVAQRISNSVRKEDIIARIDGDEFAVIIRGFKSENVLRNLAEKLMAQITRPIEVEDQTLYLSASVGIGIGPNDSDKASELIRNVELALFRAKINGRNQFEFYQFELNKLSQERIKLELEMRKGINEGEFFMMFQPIVDMDSKSIVGAEALMRWKNKKRGLISPLDFIPIAEETGLIDKLGQLAILETVALLKSMGKSRVKIRVNLSAKQIGEDDICQFIKSTLEQKQIESECFGIEITESLMMEKKDKSLEVLSALDNMGISIAIDDFGTGYSSLSYLKSFPIDCIKIDRSFIKDIDRDDNDRTLVDAILAISHKMNKTVIAEGVETRVQFEALKQMKIDKLLIQGYFFSKPLSKLDFLEQLANDQLKKNYKAS